MTGTWGADVPISMPKPPADSVLVPMFGFGYTMYGLVHEMTENDYMAFRIPSGAPDVSPADVVNDDADVDIDGEGDFL
jgi:hypothetical protein